MTVEDKRHLVRAVGTRRLEQRVADVDRLRASGVGDAGDTPIGRGDRRGRTGDHRADHGSRGQAAANKRNNGAVTHDCSWLGGEGYRHLSTWVSTPLPRQ